MKLRSGKNTARRHTQFNNLPLELQRKIFTMAASGPLQALKVGAISKVARNETKYKRAAARINKARWAHITSPMTRAEYLHNNIPHRLGRMALRMGNNQGIGPQYKIRENIKKNFRNRISKSPPTNVNNGNMYWQNNRFTYHLNRDGILRRTTTHLPPGAARYSQYIGKVN